MTTLLTALVVSPPSAFGTTPQTGVLYFDAFAFAVVAFLIGIAVGVWVKTKRDEADELRALRKLKKDDKWSVGSAAEPPLGKRPETPVVVSPPLASPTSESLGDTKESEKGDATTTDSIVNHPSSSENSILEPDLGMEGMVPPARDDGATI